MRIRTMSIPKRKIESERVKCIQYRNKMKKDSFMTDPMEEMESR